ncbi:hypothetical protein HCN44_003701 [Aphidius gifuensis]|uniref:Uncharacterized protein n=1 Tax=Aphidius gifuensis TaxID=684658 RepID=A0A834XIP6_APHGI|nr:putative F-box/LRR-repeat protein 21 [Aphidius gifuensis]KAF7987838.1 hypothetical protein HCN44_003701 [Aphidius gifuensis]
MLALVNYQLDEIQNEPQDKLKFQTLSINENSQNFDLQKNQNKTKFHRLKIDESCSISTGVLKIIKQSYFLRELSLLYSQLNEELIVMISDDDHVPLETLRIQADSETKINSKINDKTWQRLGDHSPNLNLIMTLYVDDDEDDSCLINSSIPITHLQLEGISSAVLLRKISENCLKLVELVVGSCTSDGPIDDELISLSKNCLKLTAVGIGDCEITCSGLVEFVENCNERLKLFYVWETSIIEDENFDILTATKKVSYLLKRNWTPEYISPW